MYHCATDPVLHHTGAGMVGAMIVKPKDLAAVDRELWITQQEFYIGKPGGQADMQKMQAKQPDVIAFNGYAGQYKEDPIVVRKGERIRMFVLNSGPSIWSAFHVIGTVFDKTNTCVDRPEIVRVLTEHVDLRRRGQDLETRSHPDPAALRELGDRLERHIRFEERELFPMIEAALPDDELSQLGAALVRAEARHGSCG
jgi:hypothetical protein